MAVATGTTGGSMTANENCFFDFRTEHADLRSRTASTQATTSWKATTATIRKPSRSLGISGPTRPISPTEARPPKSLDVRLAQAEHGARVAEALKDFLNRDPSRCCRGYGRPQPREVDEGAYASVARLTRHLTRQGSPTGSISRLTPTTSDSSPTSRRHNTRGYSALELLHVTSVLL